MSGLHRSGLPADEIRAPSKARFSVGDFSLDISWSVTSFNVPVSLSHSPAVRWREYVSLPPRPWMRVCTLSFVMLTLLMVAAGNRCKTDATYIGRWLAARGQAQYHTRQNKRKDSSVHDSRKANTKEQTPEYRKESFVALALRPQGPHRHFTLLFLDEFLTQQTGAGLHRQDV